MASYRLSEKARRLVEEMAQESGISRTDVVELLIRDAAKAGGSLLLRELVRAEEAGHPEKKQPRGNVAAAIPERA